MVEQRSKVDLDLASTDFIRRAIAGTKTMLCDRSIKNMLEKAIYQNEDFNCIICLTLVFEPHHCQKCETTIFCLACINHLVKKECPTCGASPFVYQKFNKFELKCLGSIMLSCSDRSC